jgi:outer membrane protein assembly factor BamC
MRNVIRSRLSLAAGLVALGAAAGCSSLNEMTEGDKIDYRTNAKTTSTLAVPPDLTQLSRDARYQSPSGGSVSATAYQAAAATPASAAAPTIAPGATDDMRIVRAGSQRWLATKLTPEQLWPQLRMFWQENGFKLVVDEPTSGLMETEWAENRAKLPQDIIRNTIGKVLDSVYSTGERDKFRTRVERTAEGSEIYISHRGMEEVMIGALKDQTKWQPRPPDPQLEATFLARVMTKLSAKDEAQQAGARPAAGASGAPPVVVETPARARALAGTAAASLQLDEGFERAWRRVGLALDRGGFTVEDRDRSNGLYYVRYIDPSKPPEDQPGFFRKLFGGGKAAQPPARYRIAVKAGSADSTTVSVLDPQGAPENGEVGKRIVALLIDELR